MSSVRKVLKEALAYHQSGDLERAEAGYDQVLSRDPNNVDALHLLGMLAQQAGRSQEAADYIGRAVQLNPAVAPFHNNLGTVLQSLGRLDEAIRRYEEAIRLAPDYPEPQVNLGNLLQTQGRHREAVERYRKALQRKPDFAEARSNLGNALSALGEFEEAAACFREALRLKPAYAEAWLNLGAALDARGGLEDAISCCREALRLNGELPEAHRNLAALLLKQQRFQEAEACCREAIRCRPQYPEAHNNLGNALQEQGRLEEASACYQEALRWNPAFAEAHNNLGNLRQIEERLEEAAACYREAVRLRPDFTQAWGGLVDVLLKQGAYQEAAGACREMLHWQPEAPQVHLNLGNALQEQDQLEEAMRCYREALRLDPGYPEAHNNLANVLSRLGRLEEAVASYQEALRLRPDYAMAHNNLGNALARLRRLDEAIASHGEALRLCPDYAMAHNSLGNALHALGRIGEAVASFREALRLKRDYADAMNNLGNALSRSGQYAEAVACYRQALQIQPDFAMAHSNLVFVMHYDPAYDAEAILEEHRRWAARHATPLATWIRPHYNKADPERPLRIGYVSPDFRLHSVAFFIEPVLAAHDRGLFPAFCYSDVPHPDAVTERLRGFADGWRNICGLTEAQVAELVRQDDIDILVDLAGHAGGNRLLAFARKPAPVQVTYLGYPNTTALATMDYRITDCWADPEGRTEHLHTEELVRLPQGFLCYQPPQETPEVSALPARQKGGITFSSFNDLAKVNPQVIATWSAILHRTAGARLVIKARQLADPGMRRRIQEMFLENGLGPERVRVLGPISSLRRHLDLYQEIDVALDTFPYHGTTTTCEALWMGVPVVVLAGRTHVCRVGISLLESVGLSEFVADSPERYVEIAANAASDLARLEGLRAEMRARMARAPLTDAWTFTRSLEDAYRQMWRRWCQGARGDHAGPL